jgi:8-oxo-dGTP diphosphatase
MSRGIIALVFRCKVTGGQLSTSDETEAFRWVTRTEIRQLTSEAYAVRVLDALQDDSPALIRQHDGTHLL